MAASENVPESSAILLEYVTGSLHTQRQTSKQGGEAAVWKQGELSFTELEARGRLLPFVKEHYIIVSTLAVFKG